MELGCAADRWVDVFVSKAADDPHGAPVDPNDQYDDEFCCSVQSVEFDPLDPTIAHVTTNDSEWIIPTWTNEYKEVAAAKSPYADVKVGDLVRVGGIHVDGFTDYLTVIEIKTVEKVANSTAGGLRISTIDTSNGASYAGTHFLHQADGTTPSTPSAAGVDVSSQEGIAHIAIRLNASFNCTHLPDTALDRGVPDVTHLQNALPAITTTKATLIERHNAFEYVTKNSTAYDSETNPSEKYYYPLYRAKNWTQGKELVARLDHGVKQVAAVKLIGYQLVNKRQVGIHHAHEMQADDFLILRIKEIEGHVISNNKFASGAFAILRAGDTSNNMIGAAEFSAYEPSGIVCVPVHASNSTIRNMTIEVIDRLGRPAHFGRLHLWFKLLVTHG